MIFDKVAEIIADQFEIGKNEITEDTSFVNDLGADSLDVVELIMAIEEEFEIEVDDGSIEQIQTVGDAVEYIANVIG